MQSPESVGGSLGEFVGSAVGGAGVGGVGVGSEKVGADVGGLAVGPAMLPRNVGAVVGGLAVGPAMLPRNVGAVVGGLAVGPPMLPRNVGAVVGALVGIQHSPFVAILFVVSQSKYSLIRSSSWSHLYLINLSPAFSQSALLIYPVSSSLPLT